MRLIAATLAVVIWICIRMIRPLSLSGKSKLLLCLITLLAGSKFLLYRILGGSFFAPHLPFAAMACGEIMYSSLIILFVLLLLADAYALLRFPAVRIGIHIPAFPITIRSAAFLAATAAAAGCWGFHQATCVPEVKHIELRTEDLPKPLDGIRIAQLTDLHIGPLLKKEWLSQVVARTNELDADIIVLTGDLADGMPAEIGAELAPLGDLKAGNGIYGVTGNHEYYSDAEGWIRLLSGLGIRMLRNEHAVPCEGITVAGVPDTAERSFGLGEGPNPSRAFADAPAGFRILLSHRPSASPSIPDTTASLQLSGHTHGGLTFFLAPLIAAFNHGYANGLSRHSGSSYVYTAPGTGLWSGFSCRIGIPSEITLFTLRSAR